MPSLATTTENICLSVLENQNELLFKELAEDPYSMFETLDEDFNVNPMQNDLSSLSIKSLSYILMYYGIPKRNMVKQDIIQTISRFESDPNNMAIVTKLRYLFHCLTMLKQDTFFKRYVLIDL